MGLKGMEKIVGDNFLHPVPPLYMYIYDLLYLLWLVLKLYIQSSVKKNKYSVLEHICMHSVSVGCGKETC